MIFLIFPYLFYHRFLVSICVAGYRAIMMKFWYVQEKVNRPVLMKFDILVNVDRLRVKVGAVYHAKHSFYKGCCVTPKNPLLAVHNTPSLTSKLIIQYERFRSVSVNTIFLKSHWHSHGPVPRNQNDPEISRHKAKTTQS